jgi:H+/gluconate symporter-like permease
MNQNTKLALVIGGIVSAVAGLTTLGVVYARFEQAQKTVKQTTLGDLLREKGTKTEDDQNEPNTEADEVEVTEGEMQNIEEDVVPVELEVTKPKSSKKGSVKE